MGSAFYVRNPEMHQTESPVEGDRVGAFERLAVMSIGARHLEAASSPVSVEDAVREASQPMFAETIAAADDLVHKVSTGQRAELVEALMDGVEAAADAGDRTKVAKLWFVYRRALHRLGPSDRAVRVAAARCGRWVADDGTLTYGIEMLTPALFPLLERRYQEKVVAALVADIGRGTVVRREVSGSVYWRAMPRLFPAFEGEYRRRIVAAIAVRLEGTWEPQAYGARLLCAVAGELDENDQKWMALVLARALLFNNPFDASDEIDDALDAGLPQAFIDEFGTALRELYLAHPDAAGGSLVLKQLDNLGLERPSGAQTASSAAE